MNSKNKIILMEVAALRKQLFILSVLRFIVLVLMDLFEIAKGKKCFITMGAALEFYFRLGNSTTDMALLNENLRLSFHLVSFPTLI